MQGMSDHELLEAYVQARNVGAFNTFVERHQGSLLAFSSSILRDETSAQDVVQEVFSAGCGPGRRDLVPRAVRR